MAMMGTRDKPTFYRIVNTRTGEELATVSKSKVQQTMKKLQQECDDTLQMFLIVD